MCNNLKVLGENIYQERVSKHVTQKQLGESIGVGPSVIHLYERGMVNIPFDRLVGIANYLEVSIDVLAGRSVEADNTT